MIENETNIISKRINNLINTVDFNLDIKTIKMIHTYLFYGIYDFAGQFRICNLTKKEPILANDTVKYADYHNIKQILVYNLNFAKEINYQKLSIEKKVNHLVQFTSNIWQAHPFRNGNTRTIETFMVKYLNYLGYNIDAKIFKEHFEYFRNALVLSNYYNELKNIYPSTTNLEKFYCYLLHNANPNDKSIKVKRKILF